MINICNMYSQYKITPDRRAQTNSVAVERRSGVDRRTMNRIKLDNNLTKDIFVLRNSVSNTDKNINKVSDGSNVLSFTQKLQKTLESLNNSKDNRDTYLNNLKKSNNTQAIKSDNTSSAGMLAGGLASVMGLTLLGIGGLAAGIGAIVYTSAKSIKHVIGSQLK